MLITVENTHVCLHNDEMVVNIIDVDGTVHEALASASHLVPSADADLPMIEIGFPVGRRDDGAYLVELPFETSAGLRRLYLSMSSISRDVDDPPSDVRLKTVDSWVGHTVASVTVKGSTIADGLRKNVEFSVNPNAIVKDAVPARGPAAMADSTYLFVVDDLRGPREIWASDDVIVPAGFSLSEALAADGDVRRHFKGGVYRRLREEGSETVYESLWPDARREHRRPTSDFEGVVTTGGREVRRFTPVRSAN